MGDINRILIFTTNDMMDLLSVLEKWFDNGRRYSFRHILFMLDLVNKFYLAFMVSSPVKSKIHIIAFFNKSLVELLLLAIHQYLRFLILKPLLLTIF